MEGGNHAEQYEGAAPEGGQNLVPVKAVPKEWFRIYGTVTGLLGSSVREQPASVRYDDTRESPKVLPSQGLHYCGIGTARLANLDLRMAADRAFLAYCRNPNPVHVPAALLDWYKTSPLLPLFTDCVGRLEYNIWPYSDPARTYLALSATLPRPVLDSHRAAVLHRTRELPPVAQQQHLAQNSSTVVPPGLPSLLCLGLLAVQSLDSRGDYSSPLLFTGYETFAELSHPRLPVWLLGIHDKIPPYSNASPYVQPTGKPPLDPDEHCLLRVAPLASLFDGALVPSSSNADCDAAYRHLNNWDPRRFNTARLLPSLRELRSATFNDAVASLSQCRSRHLVAVYAASRVAGLRHFDDAADWGDAQYLSFASPPASGEACAAADA